MPRPIQLTQQYYALVDDDLVDEIKKHRWHICMAAHDIYACRDHRTNNTRHRIYMHRQISHCPPGHQVHHRDGNTLNNTRANLEVCSQTQNLKYRRKEKKP
jgi:hypothetical protein